VTAARKQLVEQGFAKPTEAARFLGIGRTWLYELIRADAISHIRHGRRISISWAALHEYAAQRIKLGKIA
jgi:excisionase family DNA binding protein